MAGREILMGVTGGIAAYKTATLVSRLVQSGHSVTVAMTESARQFIGEATFQALTGRPVCGQIFGRDQFPLGAHIHLAERAEILCIAPATANCLAKLANGSADDLLSTLYLAFTGPTLIAPAMNSDMWSKPSVQRNLNQLIEDGVHTVGPTTGWLSCRKQGAGRMSEPEDILAAIQDLLS
ncbi:MAG: phosphopantothenoylcysteine decarboxylase [Pirellulaceae bacterium]|jgi:phosphopantothenoylcysteine decarboxylase